MRTSLSERLLDLAVSGFLWGFRILIVAAIVIGTVATIRAGKYTGEQWIDFVVFGISQGSIYALIALGYTMVYGILRMINFAHGEIFMSGAFSAYFLATWLNSTGFIDANPLLGLLIPIVFAMIMSASIAMLVERIAYRPLREAPRLVPLISAIGASFFYNIPSVASLVRESMPIRLSERWKANGIFSVSASLRSRLSLRSPQPS